METTNKITAVGCISCGYTKPIDIKYAERRGFPLHCGSPMSVDYKNTELKCPHCGNGDKKKILLGYKDALGWFQSSCLACSWETAKYKTEDAAITALLDVV